MKKSKTKTALAAIGAGITSGHVEIIGPTDAKLAAEESALLADCEKTIATHLDSFRAVGRALLEIRESKLYRLTHATFETYCAERWNLGKRRTYQIIDAATAADESEAVGVHVENEAQAAALADVPVEERPHVMAEVVADGGKVTAAKIKQAARQLEALAGPVDATAVPPAAAPEVKKISPAKVLRHVESAVSELVDFITDGIGDDADVEGIEADVRLAFEEMETHYVSRHPEHKKQLRATLERMLKLCN